MSLRVRQPEIDFEDCFPNWAPHLEFAMFMNAFSIIPVHLEPYIVKVYAEAKKLLDPEKDAELIAEVDWFCAQEIQHYRQHLRFNRVFDTPRYPEVAKISEKYKLDVDDFRKQRSLLFNLAYIEGFEAAGGVFYRIWFEKLGKYRFGAKQDALLLYDWHFAEEFEHREVAYKLYMAIAVRGGLLRRIWYGYFYRIYGVFKMLGHAGECIEAIRAHMLGVEYQSMSEAQIEASKQRHRKLGKSFFWLTIKDLSSVLSPFYNPARKPPPEGVEAILAQFDSGGIHGKSVERPSTAA